MEEVLEARLFAQLILRLRSAKLAYSTRIKVQVVTDLGQAQVLLGGKAVEAPVLNLCEDVDTAFKKIVAASQTVTKKHMPSHVQVVVKLIGTADSKLNLDYAVLSVD